MGHRSVLVWGAGGHAAVVADAAQAAGATIVGFVSDDVSLLGSPVEGFEVGIVALDRDLRRVLAAGESLPAGAECVALGVGDNRNRSAIAALIPANLMPPVIHPTAVVSATARISPGAVVLALAAVNPRANVGVAVIVNTGAIIEHDCALGDGSHVSPGAILTGGVRVADGVWIGAGAVVLPGLDIGPRAVVGAGAVVTKHVNADSVVLGVPARSGSG